MNRRSLLLGLSGVAAPYVIRTPGLLMPVRRVEAATPADWRAKIINSALGNLGAPSAMVAIRTNTGWHVEPAQVDAGRGSGFSVKIPDALAGERFLGLALCDPNMNPFLVQGISPSLTAADIMRELRPSGG